MAGWFAVCKGSRGKRTTPAEGLFGCRGVGGAFVRGGRRGLARGKRPSCAAIVRPGRAPGGFRAQATAARCRRIAVWTHRAAFARGNRPFCVNSLRSGRTGRPSCMKTGRIRDAFCDRDANSGREGPGKGATGGRHAAFPQVGFPRQAGALERRALEGPHLRPYRRKRHEIGALSRTKRAAGPPGPAAAGGRRSGGRHPDAREGPRRDGARERAGRFLAFGQGRRGPALPRRPEGWRGIAA